MPNVSCTKEEVKGPLKNTKKVKGTSNPCSGPWLSCNTKSKYIGKGRMCSMDDVLLLQ